MPDTEVQVIPVLVVLKNVPVSPAIYPVEAFIKNVS